MNAELEKAIIDMSQATARIMSIESAAERAKKDAMEVVESLRDIKAQLQKSGGEDTQQKPISEPISDEYPPNKYRVLAQRVYGALSEKKHVSVFQDFVGAINDLELYFRRCEQDGDISINEHIYQD